MNWCTVFSTACGLVAGGVIFGGIPEWRGQDAGDELSVEQINLLSDDGATAVALSASDRGLKFECTGMRSSGTLEFFDALEDGWVLRVASSDGAAATINVGHAAEMKLAGTDDSASVELISEGFYAAAHFLPQILAECEGLPGEGAPARIGVSGDSGVLQIGQFEGVVEDAMGPKRCRWRDTVWIQDGRAYGEWAE